MTTHVRERKFTIGISIHAPLVGRDAGQAGRRVCPQDFNPRAPCGARRQRRRRSTIRSHFNPRAPCGARPFPSCSFMISSKISIHAPLVGRDRRTSPNGENHRYFNPRAPCGARLYGNKGCKRGGAFQSTRPLWGATANLTEFELQICAWVTKSNRDFRGSAAACSVVLSGCAPRFWQRRCEPAGGGMIAWGSHQIISAPSGA